MSPLHTPESLAAARGHLAAADPALARIDALLPPFAWRTRPGGFAGLVRFITEQQVSVASAAAIWARLEAGLGEVTPKAVLAHDEAGLKAFGLSSPKARYAHAIADAHASGAADFDRLAELDDEAAISALTALKGVGRWTAEVYLMMCEARLDVFPAGDLALQEGLRMADEAQARPT
jgi:DNA-3-methyladenine glycosylase II